jgi:hypothetical protein
LRETLKFYIVRHLAAPSIIYFSPSSSSSIIFYETLTISIDFILSRPTNSGLKPNPEILLVFKSISFILG